MADSTSGNSEELKLRITPELDQAALKKAQEQLDGLKASPISADKGRSSGGVTSAMKAEADFLKYKLSLLREEKDIQDANLRTARSASNEKIQLLKQQGAAGKITMQQMNDQILQQQQLIERTTADSIQSYNQLSASIELLKAQYADIPGALGLIAKAELQVLYARTRATSGFDTMSSSMQTMVSQTKNANLAFMNFGRIVQDAPFGLIGIANNIDPLLMSLSVLSNEIDVSTGKVRGFGGSLKALGSQLLGPAGIIFLLGSALPSALLVLEKYQNSQSKETDESIKQAADWVAKLEMLRLRFDLAADGILSKDLVLKEYNDSVGKSIGQADDFAKADELLFQNTNKYVLALQKRIQANLLLAKASELSIKIMTGESARLTFLEKVLVTIGGVNASLFQMGLTSAKINNDTQEYEKLMSQVRELINQNTLGMEEFNKKEEEKLKYIDKTLVDQTKLKILADAALFSANNENKTWEERLKLTEQGVFYLKTAQELELKSLQDQRTKTKDLGEQLKLDSEILLKKQDMAKTDQILLDFQKKMSDARVDEMIQREQMMKQLEDEAAKFELIDVDLDLGGDFLSNRLKDAEEFIDSVYDSEIEKAIDTGNKLKALFYERKQYEDKLTRHYIGLHYSQEEARAMAQSETDIKFADRTEKTKKEIQTETIQAIGELATASLGMLFGESKNAQIAQVVIDTIMGIQKIWSQAGLNPVVGALGTAALAAKGMAAINKIRSTEVGSASLDGGSTTMGQMGNRGLSSAYGQNTKSAGSQISQSAQPVQAMFTPLISIDAQIDRKGLALAVRDGEQDIRTQQFAFV